MQGNRGDNMSHDSTTCKVCGDAKNAPKRARVLHFLAGSVNTPNAEAARVCDASRSQVSMWRAAGELAGCLPPRTTGGQFASAAMRRVRARQVGALGLSHGMRPAWPIGTIRTDNATMRLA